VEVFNDPTTSQCSFDSGRGTSNGHSLPNQLFPASRVHKSPLPISGAGYTPGIGAAGHRDVTSGESPPLRPGYPRRHSHRRHQLRLGKGPAPGAASPPAASEVKLDHSAESYRRRRLWIQLIPAVIAAVSASATALGFAHLWVVYLTPASAVVAAPATTRASLKPWPSNAYALRRKAFAARSQRPRTKTITPSLSSRRVGFRAIGPVSQTPAPGRRYPSSQQADAMRGRMMAAG